MSKPTTGSLRRLRRIGCYLKNHKRLVWNFEMQDEVDTLDIYTDSGWAGCRDTGRSTSVGVVTLGKHTLNYYSRQQKTVALSSAEAELHAMVAASFETLDIMALCRIIGHWR